MGKVYRDQWNVEGKLVGELKELFGDNLHPYHHPLQCHHLRRPSVQDTSSKLFRIGGGRREEGRFVWLKSVSSTPMQPVNATVVSGDEHRSGPGKVDGKGL